MIDKVSFDCVIIRLSNEITDDIVDSRSVGTSEEVGEEVHHHDSILFGLKKKHGFLV